MYPNVIYIHIFGYPSFPPHVSTSNKVTLIPVQSELERGCEVQRSLVELCSRCCFSRCFRDCFSFKVKADGASGDEGLGLSFPLGLFSPCWWAWGLLDVIDRKHASKIWGAKFIHETWAVVQWIWSFSCARWVNSRNLLYIREPIVNNKGCV